MEVQQQSKETQLSELKASHTQGLRCLSPNKKNLCYVEDQKHAGQNEDSIRVKRGSK